MTTFLQYGLTAAPASQPRNGVMGQAVAGAVSLAFTYIPEDILPIWLRRAVGPAIAIATMVKNWILRIHLLERTRCCMPLDNTILPFTHWSSFPL
jgi:CBS-domain-containing membrane protein